MLQHAIEQQAIDALMRTSHPLSDLSILMDRIGDARIVMLGEASHGTHEYYTWRTHLTQRLINEKGFNSIAVEGDWPDCYRINRYIRGYGKQPAKALEVLNSLNRWPTWMWANWEMVALTEWLQQHNRHCKQPVGFYGLDVYSLWESMDAIIQYLQRTDAARLPLAMEAFTCFEPYRKDEGQGYARASQWAPELCEHEVVDLLQELQQSRLQADDDPESAFNAEQNAFVAVNAERYYRAMVKGGPEAWNIRDRHMAHTLERLLHFYGAGSKIIVWAHNTHIGDARATDMAQEGMTNIGQLVREQFGPHNVVLIGFGSYSGRVIAGNKWGAAMQRMEMPPAAEGTWEYLLHQAGASDKFLIMDELTSQWFTGQHIGHRAIGVVYHPGLERFGNFVPTILPMRYDAFIYIDRTSALHPLHVATDGQKMPETYPFGM